MADTALREYVDFLVEAALDEKLRGGFDLSQFKRLNAEPRSQKEYADEHLQQLACGSSRCSYILSGGKILKLLAHPANLDTNDTSQNRGEMKSFQKFGPDYVPRVYDYSPTNTWLIVEPTRTFTSNSDMYNRTGVDRLALIAFGQNIQRVPQGLGTPEAWNHVMQGKKLYHQYWQTLKPLGKQLVEKLKHLMDNGVVDIARADHWGWTADGRLVCVDTGIDDDNI